MVQFNLKFFVGFLFFGGEVGLYDLRSRKPSLEGSIACATRRGRNKLLAVVASNLPPTSHLGDRVGAADFFRLFSITFLFFSAFQMPFNLFFWFLILFLSFFLEYNLSSVPLILLIHRIVSRKLLICHFTPEASLPLMKTNMIIFVPPR
jgi:hypothetical protein